jgi:hypothetical protein
MTDASTGIILLQGPRSQVAFDGLLKLPSSIDCSKRAEREPSVGVLVDVLGDFLQKTETMSRITEEINMCHNFTLVWFIAP